MTTTDTETLEGFFNSRADFLRIETVTRPDGCWDVMLRIDGTYRGELIGNKEETADYFREWLLPLLLKAGIDRLYSWHREANA